MDALMLRDLATLATPFLTLFVGGGIGATGYFLKNLHRDIKTKFVETDKRIERLEREFMEHRAALPREFVLRDDFIRTIAGFDLKLDRMDKKIDTLMRYEEDQK